VKDLSLRQGVLAWVDRRYGRLILFFGTAREMMNDAEVHNDPFDLWVAVQTSDAVEGMEG
jgi:hypothetical protein